MNLKAIFLFLGLLLTTPVFAECPADKPAQWLDGQCYSCQELKSVVDNYMEHQPAKKTISLSDENAQDELDDTLKLFELFFKLSKVCPDEEEQKQLEEMKPVDGKCPPEKPLKDLHGLCHPCNDTAPFEMDFADLPQCESLCLETTPRYRVNQYCTPKKCPNDAPLMDSEGNCRSCDDTEQSIKAVDGCLTCSNRYISGAWSHNSVSGNSCRLKNGDRTYNEAKYAGFLNKMQPTCPDNKPILSQDGQCYPCLYHKDIQALSGCDKCAEREITVTSASSYDFLHICALKED